MRLPVTFPGGKSRPRLRRFARSYCKNDWIIVADALMYG
jgi:hypothetical protein